MEENGMEQIINYVLGKLSHSEFEAVLYTDSDIWMKLQSLVSDDIKNERNFKDRFPSVYMRLDANSLSVRSAISAFGFDDDFGRALGGGGRYDKMIEKFLGTPVPAVGCSIGLYPVAMLMVERGYYVPSNKLALVYDKNQSYEQIMNAKIDLIAKGYDVATFAFPKNFNNFAD